MSYRKINKNFIYFHLYNLNLFQEFSEYIDNVFKVFQNSKLIINTIYNKEYIDFTNNVIRKKYPNSITLFNINRGADIGGLFNILKYTSKNNLIFNYIIFMHTKSSDDKWRKELIEPITNICVMKKIYIQINNLNIPDIGFIASKKYIIDKEYDNDFPKNKEGILIFLEKFFDNNLEIYNLYKYFVGGTMFWINAECLKRLTPDIIKYFENNLSDGKPPCNLTSDKIHSEYIMERIITGILTIGYKNIVIDKNNISNITN